MTRFTVNTLIKIKKSSKQIKRETRVHTEEVDVDLLQVVHTAELVELVVDLVVDEGLVVVSRVVLHCVVHCTTQSTHLTQSTPGHQWTNKISRNFAWSWRSWQH